MPSPEWLAEQFEQHRAHLGAVAYRMLGSANEADDAVQESSIRLDRTDVSDVQNLHAWLTTVVSACVWTFCGRGHHGGRTPWTPMCQIP
jgi:DNA-directed RNA polymerase specialized sigma24 family protein